MTSPQTTQLIHGYTMIWTQDCQISSVHHSAFHFLCVLKLHDLVLHDFVLYVLSGPLSLILLFLNIWPCMMEAAATWVALISVHVIKPLLTSKHASLVAQMIKNLPAMQETWVRSLGWEDPLEKKMATRYSTGSGIWLLAAQKQVKRGG